MIEVQIKGAVRNTFPGASGIYSLEPELLNGYGHWTHYDSESGKKYHLVCYTNYNKLIGPDAQPYKSYSILENIEGDGG